MKRYLTAIYLRLSKEDDRNCDIEPSASISRARKKESNSIAMQRILLRKYIEENLAGCEVAEFCDDGYTGTNFDRPGMQEMLRRIRDGEINCVVVKDFSRFARDHVELGAYLEQIFPFLGVRFISVNDGYDSDDYQGSVAGIDMNFRNLLYDLYSKDLSEKVRSSLAVRKEKGLYVSGNSPFGYEKDPENRHALLVAEDEAAVVRRIFALTLEGHTSVEIAKLFNKEGVKTPVAFKIEKGKTSRTPKGESFLWSGGTICQILRNEVYIGNIVQKKYAKDFVGGKNHLKPRGEWLVSCGHHQPIISKETFEKVQEGRGRKRPPQKNRPHPLMGKAVCGGCKKNLRYRRGGKPYFDCRYRYSNGLENCVCKVEAARLEEYVLWQMQDRLKKDGEAEGFREEVAEGLNRKMGEGKEKRKLLLTKLERLRRQNFQAYQDYASGKAEDFQSCQSRISSLEEELRAMESELQAQEASFSKLRSELQAAEASFSDLECGGGAGKRIGELSKEMIEDHIDRIEVYNERHIEIRWKR